MKPKHIRKYIYLGLTLLLLYSCRRTQNTTITETDHFLRGSDLSALPEIESDNVFFYNGSEEPEGVLALLKAKGLNTL